MRSSLPQEQGPRSPSVAERTDTAQHQPSWRPANRAPLLNAGIAALWVSGLLVLLGWTLFTDASHLDADFWTDRWLIAQQAEALRHGGGPSLFAHGEWATFYPVFAFYGGTLFAVAGAIAIVVGSAIAAQVIVYLLALAAAYGGWLWLARLAGLRSWPAHVPAVLYVTMPYVLTNVYIRQDLTELVATAVIPLLLAAALSILRSRDLRAGPAAALAGSTIIVGGSHNLTLLWGTTVLGIVGLALVIGVPGARSLFTRRGVVCVLAVTVPAMAVNAWYLLPDLAYHADTVIFNRLDDWKALLRGPNPELSAKYLFALGRPSAYPGSGLTCTLPVLAMAWVIVATVIARPSWRDAWARTLAILSLATAVVLVIMTHPKSLLVLPDPWLTIQFSYRLETFALYGICGAVIAALVLLGPSRHRWLTWLLLPIAALSIVGAADQMRTAPRSQTALNVPLDTYVTIGIGDYGPGRLRPLSARNRMTSLLLTRKDVKRGRIDGTIRAQPGELVYDHLMTPPQLIDVQGARVVGRRALPPVNAIAKPRWYLVMQLDRDTPPGAAHIVIREARTLPIVGGRILSILGLLGLAINAAVIARTARRRRRRARPAP